MERLSGLDASFLYAETNNMLMHVAFVAICDASDAPGGYSFRKIYDLLDVKTQQEPAFRRRLCNIPLNLHHPIWIDDPNFQITDHLHQYTLAENSGMEQLGHKIGRIMSRPLDRSRPLWEAWVIQGLEGNRFALVLKIHHAMVDGVSGTDLFRNLFTTSANYEPPIVERSKGEKIPTNAELIAHAMRSKLKSPKKFLNVLSDSVGGITSIARGQDKPEERGRPLSAPRTHFNKRITSNRDVALVQISLDEVKAVKNATGATVNDVILTVCGGAIKRYLETQNDLPEKSLVAMVPISVRKQSNKMVTNNQVSGMWSTLATNVEDPLERIKLIHEDTKDAKVEHDAVGADLLQDWAEFNTPGAFNLAMRFYASTLVDYVTPVHNTIISNVPGPRETLYFAGSEIECICPIGPVMEGVGLNISLASYKDCVGFTMQVDNNLIQDVNLIANFIKPAFDDLKQRAGIKRSEQPPRIGLQKRPGSNLKRKKKQSIKAVS